MAITTPSNSPARSLPPFLIGLGIAIAYCVTGKLGLLLAIPPGYATAIWPASGIALAALILYGGRFWPAVWLGSMATNILVAFTANDPATLERLVVTAFSIGIGAAAQAYVGYALIKRVHTFPVQLIAAKEVFRFLILGGPFACLVSASWGVSVLVLNGSLPLSGAAYSWWTWWVGDTVGVLIFAPLALMWLDRSPAWRTRRWIVTASLGATFIAAVMVFVYASRSEWDVLKRSFDKSTHEIGEGIKRRVDLHAGSLESISALFAASAKVDREEFRRFTRSMVAPDGDVLGVGWVPRVPHAQRAAIEAKLPASARHPFFFEMQKPWPKAGDRDEYTPVLFFTPRSTVDISGFDLSSDTVRRETLRLARDRGTLTATPMVPMTLAPGEPYDGFLLVEPIYSREEPMSAEERRASLLGYAIKFFRLSEFLGHHDVVSIAGDRIHFSLEDVTDRSHPTRLFQHIAHNELSPLPGMSSATSLSVGGRQWRITFTPTLAYVAGNTTMVVWLVLAGGLVFSALVGIGALILTGRTAEVEAIVKKRTDELAVISGESDRLKHEFISVVSHELRTPLTSIRGSLGLVASGAAGPLSLQAQNMTTIALRNCERLSKLINELLDIEKMESGHLALDLQMLSLNALIDQAVESNAGYAKEHEVEFLIVDRFDGEEDLRVRADPDRLLQVLANLLSNAAKFSARGSRVEVGTQRRGNMVRVFVRDYGNGIAREFQPRIFQKFSQADGSDARPRHGTGLGLAISKSLIERMDGRIDYMTQEGHGTTFFFDLPRIQSDTANVVLRVGAA